jgi:hypothetical protein
MPCFRPQPVIGLSGGTRQRTVCNHIHTHTLTHTVVVFADALQKAGEDEAKPLTSSSVAVNNTGRFASASPYAFMEFALDTGCNLTFTLRRKRLLKKKV